jgi:hypothetical protein
MIKSLADALLSIPQETRTKDGKSSTTLASMERNSCKPCTACGHPQRHRSKSGRCYTTLCTEHYRAYQQDFRRKAKIHNRKP